MKRIRHVLSRIKYWYIEHAREIYQHLFIKPRYHGGDLTILSNTCAGAVIYHQIGRKFMSPTINLKMDPLEFCYFCNNIDSYLGMELEEDHDSKSLEKGSRDVHPLGILVPSDLNLPIIHIVFVHYNSFSEAKRKWEERKQRILLNKIFVVLDLSNTYDASGAVVSQYELIKYHKLVIGCDKNENRMISYNYINFHKLKLQSRLFQYCGLGRVYLNKAKWLRAINQL